MKPILFVSDARQKLIEVLEEYEAEQIFVLMDENTNRHCLPVINNDKLIPEHFIIVPAGEENKSLAGMEIIWQHLSSQGARRNAVLVNLGGGMIGDMGGFAASCFKRGIKFINIPTTLLAQIDASVGGKTGINFNGLKNEIGAFSVPEVVIIDLHFLKTLPHRQVLSGFAEMLKHGLLSGGRHFRKLLTFRNVDMSAEEFFFLLKESVGFKRKIVEKDPIEHGVRKILNFGHTVGHALESIAMRENAEFYHGDAVAYGIIVELYLSVLKTGFNPDIYRWVKEFILDLYPRYTFSVSPELLYELMLHDKKNRREGINFTLLEDLGKPVIDNYCSRKEIMKALSVLPKTD